jgi:hypothetical protein
MENKLPKSKIIKKNSVIKVNFSTGMLVRLQQIQAYLINSASDEQLKKYGEEIKKYDSIIKNTSTFSEEWMTHLTTITLLLVDIQKYADEQNLTEEIDTEDTLKQIINNSIEDYNSPDTQSQSQPE